MTSAFAFSQFFVMTDVKLATVRYESRIISYHIRNLTPACLFSFFSLRSKLNVRSYRFLMGFGIFYPSNVLIFSSACLVFFLFFTCFRFSAWGVYFAYLLSSVFLLRIYHSW